MEYLSFFFVLFYNVVKKINKNLLIFQSDYFFFNKKIFSEKKYIKYDKINKLGGV